MNIARIFVRKYFLTLCLLLLVFLGLFSVYSKFIYTFGFTDEGDNISIGKFLLQDKKLYKDIFSQHQPLTYYVSSAIQKAAPADNILLVIRRHRQFIMLFSFLWIAFLTIRFGYRLLPFLFLVELLKYYYLGHLFLAESLVIYPLAYLFCLFWQVLLHKNLSRMDAVIASLSAFFVVFNLLPVGFAVLAMIISMLVLLRKKKNLYRYLIIPGVIATVVLFIVVPVTSYLDATIIANIFYYAPQSNQYAFRVETGPFETIARIVFWPVLYFLRADTVFAYTQIVLVFTWLIFMISYGVKTKQYLVPLFSYALLCLLNLRPPIDSLIYYHAFHSLPFFAVYVTSIALVWKEIETSSPSRKQWLYAVPIFILFTFLIVNTSFYYRGKISERDTQYVEFIRVYSFSDTVRSLASSGDTFAVYPYDELMYWYTGLFPPTRFLFYESWVYDVPTYRQEINNGLEKNPPTFVYAPSLKLAPYLQPSEYISLPHNDATVSALFVRKEKLPSIDQKKWEQITQNGFSKPKK